MIARAHKVPLRNLPTFFQTAFRTGVRGISCYWQPHDGPLQLAVIVAKKTAPKATARAAVRRSAYELLEKKVAELPVTQPLQVVCIIEPLFVRAESTERAELLHKLLQKVITEYAKTTQHN